MSAQIILVGGGARAGKSSFALGLARRFGERRVFIATARAGDEEMRARIARHQAERGDDFRTVEEPVALAHALAGLTNTDVVVVDCVTFWLSNLLLDNLDDAEIDDRMHDLVAVLRGLSCPAIMVSNEVGMGVVPETALGRRFRDLAGRAHQLLARAADEIYFAALGTMLRIKPGPIEIQT